MGFYIRKSFKLGPIRLNVSRSGLGMSAGVKGARFGINAGGKKYVHVGRGGLYYRENLPGSTQQESGEPQSASDSFEIGWATVLIILAIFAAFFLLYHFLLS